MEEETLASELLHEIKLSARRWFIAFCAMAALEFGTVVGFLSYISLPTTEEVHVENDDGNANYVNGNVDGGIHNGENNSNPTERQSEESSQK